MIDIKDEIKYEEGVGYIFKIKGDYFREPEEVDTYYDSEDEEYSEEYNQLTKDIEYAYIFGEYRGVISSLPKYTLNAYWYWDAKKGDEDYKGEEPNTLEGIVHHFKESYETEDVEVIQKEIKIKTEIKYKRLKMG